MSEIENTSSEIMVGSEKFAPSMSDHVETQGWDAHNTKKLLRKMDWHIIPFMSLIYLYVLAQSSQLSALTVFP
jgi:hypothetical protein